MCQPTHARAGCGPFNRRWVHAVGKKCLARAEPRRGRARQLPFAWQIDAAPSPRGDRCSLDTEPNQRVCASASELVRVGPRRARPRSRARRSPAKRRSSPNGRRQLPESTADKFDQQNANWPNEEQESVRCSLTLKHAGHCRLLRLMLPLRSRTPAQFFCSSSRFATFVICLLFWCSIMRNHVVMPITGAPALPLTRARMSLHLRTTVEACSYLLRTQVRSP